MGGFLSKSASISLCVNLSAYLLNLYLFIYFNNEWSDNYRITIIYYLYGSKFIMDNGNDVLMEDLLSKIAEENREQFIEDLFESGATRKQLYGIPDSLMNGFYACAYEYYQKGEIEKAEHFFKFLMMYDFYNPDYAFGLAAVYQLKQDYKHALDIYAIAYALDDDNLRAIFEAGQCYMHLHNYSKARDSFGEVVAHEKDPELVKRAEVYLKALTKINDSDEDHYHVRNSK